MHVDVDGRTEDCATRARGIERARQVGFAHVAVIDDDSGVSRTGREDGRISCLLPPPPLTEGALSVFASPARFGTDAFPAVIAVDEHEIDRPASFAAELRRSGDAGLAHPANGAVGDGRDFTLCNQLRKTHAQTASHIRIDRPALAVGGHGGAQALVVTPCHTPTSTRRCRPAVYRAIASRSAAVVCVVASASPARQRA